MGKDPRKTIDIQLFREIAREVERDFGMSGLSDGLYFEFALACAIEYVNYPALTDGACPYPAAAILLANGGEISGMLTDAPTAAILIAPSER